MSLRRDFSLSKDFDFENDSEMERLYQGYEAVKLPGHFFKKLLTYFMRIYKGCCGEGEGINKVYHSLEQYLSINVADANYSFAEEAESLRNLYESVNEYSKELDELNGQLDSAIDRWLSGIHSGKLTDQQRAEDLKYVAQSALLFNRRDLVYTTNSYIGFLMNGTLEYEDAYEVDDDDFSLGALELPLFVHYPVVEDISQNSLGESRLMQILYNIVALDSQPPMKMLHDCNNGNAIVRLWKKENGEDKPYYFTVDKKDVYIARFGDGGEKSLWPGLVEVAIGMLECSSEEIPYAVLGPDLNNYDLETILGPNNPPVYETNQRYNDMIHEYITCYYDAYSMLLLADSLMLKDTLEYTRLAAAVWEVIYALACCFDRTFDVVSPAIKFLESAIAEYKESVQENVKTDPVVKKRIAICNMMETINKIGTEESEYRRTPRLYFEKKLAAKVAKVLLESMHEEETPQSLNSKMQAVLANKNFKKQTAKLNVYMMNNASEKFAASVLAKL